MFSLERLGYRLVGGLSSMNKSWGSMDKSWGSIGRGIWVDSSSIICDFSNIAIDRVRMIVNTLGPSIREVDRVRTLSITSSITGLSSIEVGAGIVISNSIVVCVGRDFIRIDFSSTIGRGSNSMSQWGMSNQWGSMEQRGSMDSNNTSLTKMTG